MAIHNDITKKLYEGSYRDHKILIVERTPSGKSPILWFYIHDRENNQKGGIHYFHYRDIQESDLKTFSVALKKIKQAIDNSINDGINKDKNDKKNNKVPRWSGQSFKRGDYVYFKGNKDYPAMRTYVWASFFNKNSQYYIIEHEKGFTRDRWLNKRRDGFQAIHSSELNEGVKYIQINCNPEFKGETDQLELIQPAT